MVFLMVAVSVLLIACGSGSDSVGADQGVVVEREVIKEVPVERQVSVEKEVKAVMLLPVPAIAATPALALRFASSPDSSGGARGALEVVERKVISTASITVQVDEVQQAVAEVRLIAEGLGGFVERLSSFGREEEQRATITVRVPQSEFFTALERIEALGELQGQNLGSEDVSEQFIDLEARLKSSLREEKSLLSLLERANLVSEILTIERELSRVRSQIERSQGQLNFLERRVDLSTISVTLVPPDEVTGEPPFASLILEVSDVTGSVDDLKALLSRSGGETDSVLLFLRGGKERADISLRVFTPDFGTVVDFLEGDGKLVSKELREGKVPAGGDAEPPEEPDARIDVVFTEAEKGGNTGLIIAIVAPIGGVALAGLLGLLFYLVYRVGRRRTTAG